MNCITLLTDFGLTDEYVGVMKGVILSIQPRARIVDICHEIPPQDLAAAARMLLAAYDYFPEDTVHVCVVDPGVGTDRAIIAARAGGHRFLAPDNGLLFPLLQNNPPETLVRVASSAFFLPEVSHTFHGRDIFAPAAAHLSRGTSMSALGPAAVVGELVPLALSHPRTRADGTLEGAVVGADRFGNLLTDIHRRHIESMALPDDAVEIVLGESTISGISVNYGRPGAGGLVAVIGSRGHLEIALCGRNAHRCLNAAVGDPVTIRRQASVKETEQDP